ncbi:MAG: fibronectin type III domain-containing protein, partial [Acutalibacteraceae bacterium]
DKTWYAAWWAKNLTATFVDNENNVVGTVQGKVDKTLGKVSASDVYAIAIPEYIEKSDDNDNYVFSGWIVDSAVDENGDDYTEIISGMSPDEAILQGDVTFRAAYDVSKNSYNVKFYDVNGNLTEAEYAYNELPTQPDDQNLDENNTYTYLFKGWKKVSDGRTDYYLVDENGYDDNGNYIPLTTDFTVRTDAVYVPVFEKVYKEYTVSFTYDGVTNKTVYNALHYGDTYEVPVPEASYINDGYRYTYNGWMLNGNPATPETVKGNAAYVADYTITPAVYTVRFFDYDGTQINDQDDQYNHGDAIRVTNADATQVYTDDSYEYTFDHFECSDGDTFVDGSLALTDVDYYAVYNKTELIYYNVTWLDENNKILQTQTVRSGSDAVYSGKTPTKSADDNYHYIFKGWSDETTNIQEDISVTTVFEAAAHNYSVVSVTDPTCITDGYTTYTCSVCGESYTDNIVDPLGHDYVTEHFEKDEENDGYTLYTCSRCGDSYTVIDPAQPVESFVAIAGAYQISLSWLKSPEASVTGYKIYRKTANEEYSLIKTITSRNTLSYIDSPLDADTEYTYKIMAVKGDIPGEYSEEISCTPERDTQPPEITSATPANMSKLNKTITFKVNSTDNMSYVSYTIEYINSTDKESTVVVTSDLMECSCDFSYAFDTASLSDGTYNFVFTATDKEGNVSDKITRTYLIDNTPPEKVEQLTATVVYDTKLTLKWKDVSDADRAGYRLQQKDGDTYKTIASSVSTIGYNVSSLVPDTEYTFRVAAYDQLGNIGEYSDDYTISTTADETAPTITKLSPIPARYSGIIPFSATAKDDYSISEIKIQISEDKEAWTTVYTETFSSKSSATCSAEIDVSGEKEGSLFVRAVATDSFGNVSDESETAAYVEYYIDHTAPLSPENVSAVGYDGYIGISWEQGSESDLAKYSLYRSEEENGTYELLSSSINTINYYDRSVERGKVYYYKLAVNDTAGNLSAYSQIVFASALSDEEKPEIVSISPSDGESLSPSSNIVSVLAKDNNELSTITIEYKLSDEDEYTTLETFSGIGNYYKTVSTSVDLSTYDTATVINIRAYCTDVSGYTSSYSYRTLKVDKTAPKVTNLSAVLCDKTITVSWNDDGESDLSGFKIYKSKDGSSYSAVATRSVSTSRYYSVINTLDAGTYTYRIDAYDNYGNSKSYYTDSLVIESEPNISPVIDCVSYIEAGVSETFSSASSVHDYDISAYLWDFGDGTTSVKANPTKSYKQAGTYTVSLTLTDVNGVSKTASKSVTVNERNMLGTSRIRVVNESGSGVASIPVYFDLGQDNQQVVYTNSNGYASAVLSVGKHIVGAYKTGYLPVTKEVTVLSASVTDTVLNITEENIISGEFTVTEMTLDEIVAAGIDVSDPANQQTYQVSVTLIYGEQKIPVTYIRNDTKIISFKIDDYDFKTNNSNYKPISISYIPNDRNEEIIAVAAIDCTASYLKQFFNATLTIFNNAAESFNIVDCSADINVPDGLTVVKNSPISSVIPGQSSSSETWILRGDKEGTYNLTSSFSGNLDVFNVPVSATFKADNSVHVYGTDSVKLRFEVEDTIEDDGSLFFNIMLINQRDVNVYNPIINVGGITDKLIEYLQAEGENTESLTDDEKAAIKNAYILPLRIRVDHSDGTTDLYDYSPISPVDTLAPGDSLVYEFEAKGLKTNGALGYFNRAIIDCDEDYAGSIEVVTMGDKPVYISEDDFVKEHLDFLSSGGYTAIATPFSIDIGTEAGKSFEKKWDQFIELDYFTNYCELVLCDFILKDSTYSRYEKIQKEKYFSSVKKWTSAISDAVMLDKYASYTQGLNKNKIEKILEGASYESNDYRVLNKVLGMMFDDGTIKELYSAYNFTGNMISIFNTGADMVNRIRNSMSYASAVDAYREFSDTLKELFENASLDTSNKKMKDAMNSFIAADSSEFESNLIKSGAYLKGI